MAFSSRYSPVIGYRIEWQPDTAISKFFDACPELRIVAFKHYPNSKKVEVAVELLNTAFGKFEGRENISSQEVKKLDIEKLLGDTFGESFTSLTRELLLGVLEKTGTSTTFFRQSGASVLQILVLENILEQHKEGRSEPPK